MIKCSNSIRERVRTKETKKFVVGYVHKYSTSRIGLFLISSSLRDLANKFVRRDYGKSNSFPPPLTKRSERYPTIFTAANATRIVNSRDAYLRNFKRHPVFCLADVCWGLVLFRFSTPGVSTASSSRVEKNVFVRCRSVRFRRSRPSIVLRRSVLFYV